MSLPHRPPPRSAADGARFRVGPARWWLLILPVVAVGACGRSAPDNALDQPGNDPEIAGVSITSPDTVVDVDPTAPTLDTTATTTAPASPTLDTYVVQPGDTLSGIAGNFGVTIDALAQANGIVDVHSITPGDQLVIPAAPAPEPEPAAQPAPAEQTAPTEPIAEGTTSVVEP